MRKILISIVIILIILSSTSISGMIKVSCKINIGRSILYVGGMGPGNYSKIQDAIDDATVGDIIRVYSGIYSENVVVYKKLNLIGDGPTMTIIDGGYTDHKHVISITANEVEISGFGLINSYMGHEFGGFGIQSSYNKIYNNYCWNNLYGAILFSGNNMIFNNSFSSNKRTGIFIKSSGNIIDNNNCCDSNESDGIWLYICNDNIISNNTCSNNDKNGICLYQSNNNQIINNNCHNNVLYDGILIYESSNNIASYNILSSNNDDGIGISYYSENNTISENNITNNICGIDIDYYSKENIVKANMLTSNNGYGIRISSDNNLIIHNNFDTNTLNAYDQGYDNTWNNNYPSGGNFWDDYSGNDNNKDGIGDIPYDIPGGSNWDFFPLIYRWGENPPVANFTYNSNFSVFDGSNSYDRDGIVVSYEWDFGDGTNGIGMIVSHIYNETGTYNVTLTATDDDFHVGIISKCIIVMISNQPPDAPTITGINNGKPNIAYDFTINSIDSNEDNVRYIIEWGDENMDVTEFNPSGTNVMVSHSWSEIGSYECSAYAEDEYGAIGNETIFTITIKKSKSINNSYTKILQTYLNLFLLQRLTF